MGDPALDAAKALAAGMGATVDVPTGADGKPVEYVPWYGMNRPTGKDIKDDQRDRSPAAADAYAAELNKAGQGVRGPDPRLATLEEKQAGMWDPETGFSLVDRSKEYADWQKKEARVGAKGQILREAQEVNRAILQMTPAERKVIADKMVAAGMIDEQYDMSDVEKAWTTLVGDAIDWHAANPNDLLTPVDMIDLKHGDGTGGMKKPVDVISKSTSISTNDQARNMLRQMMAQQLGRRPTQVEIDDFQGSLNEAQRNNPTVTTRTQQANGDSSSTTTGGMDESEFAYDAVVSDDPDSEYGKYTQATQYYNAFLSAIRGPGGTT